jgi:putative Mg2+ transporter-C (MgtC) family protein
MSDVWYQISSTIAAEFSDLNDVTEITRLSVRLLMAALLGGILGFEREQRGKAAGIRTHMLVAIGAALFVLIPQQAGISNAELSRVVQGVIAGIGFLGAGAILKGNDEKHLKGLTTAAGIWLTAAIGVAAGLGREASAILCTLLALTIFFIVPKILAILEWSNKRKRHPEKIDVNDQ